jgi:hypothetical protein
MTAVLPDRPSAVERRAAPSLAAAVHDLDRRRARSRQRMIGASELGECRRQPTNTRTWMQALLGALDHQRGQSEPRARGQSGISVRHEDLRAVSRILDRSSS